jgi:hypothetical protein
MPITMIDRNGPPAALICPAVICDACGRPINAVGPAGLVEWNVVHEDDSRPLVTEVSYVHKGRCDRSWNARKPHLYSRDLREYMAQLAANFAHPFVHETGVEYIAPAPSNWRLGTRGVSSPTQGD